MPFEIKLTEKEAADTRRVWLAGLCPCCSSELYPWPDRDGNEVEPETVAEEVVFCGRCILNRHHEYPEGVLEAILEALVVG